MILVKHVPMRVIGLFAQKDAQSDRIRTTS
jgi:hypothetical protein